MTKHSPINPHETLKTPIFNTGTVSLSDCTISANSATPPAGLTGPAAGGGVFQDPAATGSINLRNTIAAGNSATTGPDVAGSVISQGHNLIGRTDGSSGWTAGDLLGGTTDATKLDPLLAPLGDYGGPTFTMNLKAGSAAIDAGDDSVLGPPLNLATDQRGYSRKSGARVDIGAFEVNPPVVTNTNDRGVGSLRDTISFAASGDSITFAANVRGAINLTSAELLIGKNLTISGPGANLLSVQRSAASGTPNFRIFSIATNVNATISGLTIAKGNVVGGSFGGGISNLGTLILTNGTISDNSADFAGGGIHNNGGALTLISSTISGNSVGIGGAGILNSGTASITNSTISGNMAKGGNGGGFVNSNSMTLTNSTVSGNSATGGGGGVHNFNGMVTSRNTIIALNTAPSGPDFNGALKSDGFNLIGNASGTVFSPAALSDQLGVTAAQLNLDTLQDKGGPTKTHALLSGSFAVDKGHSSGSTTDQRGFTRPVGTAKVSGGDGSDIGAFEYGGVSIDIDGNHSYDALTDGLLIIRYMFGVTGASLTSGAIGPGATRATPTEIVQFLESIRSQLDVDGNGNADALTDGLILIRYLFGLRGSSLISGAIGAGATRTTTAQIEAYIQSLIP